MRTVAKTLLPAYLLALVILARPAPAADLPIANHSFEEPDIGSDWIYSIQDWTQSSDTTGTWHPSSVFFDLSTLDGAQNAFLNGGQIAQQLSTGLALGQLYRLSALFGTMADRPFVAGGTLELWAGGTVAAGDVTGGTLLGSVVVADADLVAGQFLRFQTLIAAPSSGPLGGELLAVRFVSNGRESEIDNIHLEVVPEPASIVLAGLGCVGVAAVAIRRKRPRDK